MKKATSVVDERTNKRLAFAGMLMSHVGVLPDSVIDRFSQNERRGEIPDRLLWAFIGDEEVRSAPTVPTSVQKVALPPRPNDTILTWLTKWPLFCQEFGLKIELDFKALKTDPRILGRPQGFDWFVYKPQGFTARQAISILEKLGRQEPTFTVWEEIPVEGYASTETRPSTPHLILCRASIEPDKEWRISADRMRATPTTFMDHTERYLFEAFHWWLYKKGLDINTWTRCPRSRTRHDNVACADRLGSRFGARRDNGDAGLPNGGGREVVIL